MSRSSDVPGQGTTYQHSTAIARAGAAREQRRLDARHEGIDNDGDGQVNEDRGRLRPQPQLGGELAAEHVQYGARDYPLCSPNEGVTRFLSHPNIAGVQSYHNTGGMILRGPGAEGRASIRARVGVYDEIGRKGEGCSLYRDLVIWSGLYTVHGGFIDWTNEGSACVVHERAVERRPVFQQPRDWWSSSRTRTARSRVSAKASTTTSTTSSSSVRPVR